MVFLELFYSCEDSLGNVFNLSTECILDVADSFEEQLDIFLAPFEVDRQRFFKRILGARCNGRISKSRIIAEDGAKRGNGYVDDWAYIRRQSFRSASINVS